MKGYIYLLKSEKDDNLYLGSTNDINVRLFEHNQGVTKATKNKRPWKILSVWEFNSLKEARQMEYKIKKMKHKFSEEYISYFLKNVMDS